MSSLEIRSAKKAEIPVMAALMDAYLAEFATFDTVPTDADGNYFYPYFNHYWEDPNRYPFLFRVDDKTAGFAMLRFEADPVAGFQVMHVAEFYVTPDFRRHGIGTEAATRLWDLFPGRWSLKVLSTNKKAYPFWKQAVSDYTQNDYTEQGPIGAVADGTTFTFESRVEADLPDDIDPDVFDF